MIFQLTTLFVTIQAVFTASTGSTETLSNGDFSTDLFAHIIKNDENSKNNLIFSPTSIQTCLALAYFGAEDTTASEMINGLHFNTQDKNVIAKQFENMLQVARGPTSLIKLANKIYSNKDFEIKTEFNEIAKKSFESEAESLDFTDNHKAVNTINEWVAKNTNNKITDLVTTGEVTPATQLVLVNAIHFLGRWKIQLHLSDGAFLNNGVDEIKTKLMFTRNDFMYADLNDLNAKAIKMPYDKSDLSLFLILPNDKTGFSNLQDKLKSANLLDLAEKLKKEDVSVTIPKFRIETKLGLKNILEDMGIKTMFTDEAKFNFFKSTDTSKVGDVIHKAFIDVNELGTEAAAATAVVVGHQITSFNMDLNQKNFDADHPFFFAIVDKSNVYFSGYLLNV